jgi:hypothetical protein
MFPANTHTENQQRINAGETISGFTFKSTAKLRTRGFVRKYGARANVVTVRIWVDAPREK